MSTYIAKSNVLAKTIPLNKTINNNSNKPGHFDKLSGRFQGFDRNLKLAKKKRIQVDDERINHLQLQINELKDLITVETKTRQTNYTALQNWAADQFTKIPIEFKQLLNTFNDQINKKIDLLDKKIIKIQQEEVKNNEIMIEKMKLYQIAVEKELKQASIKCDNYAHDHEEQTERIDDKVNKLNAQVVADIKDQKINYEKRYIILENQLKNEIEQRDHMTLILQQNIDDNISAIKTVIEQEVKERVAGDDELIIAINHYTAAVQDSVQIVSDLPEGESLPNINNEENTTKSETNIKEQENQKDNDEKKEENKEQDKKKKKKKKK